MVYGRSIAIGGCLLAIVILLSGLVLYLSMGPCPQGTFACDNGKLCVPQRQICDYHVDCKDKSDEHPVKCGLLYGSKELTDKIVGLAIKKQRQQQELQQQQQQGPTVSSSNRTLTPTNDNEDNGAVNNNGSNGNGSSSNGDGSTGEVGILAPKCEITTYPPACTCQRRIVFCGRRAGQLNQVPQISDEVTVLIINGTNLELNENAFVNLRNLRRLTLKHNNISRIPMGTFNGLHQLQCLNIHYNNFTVLPRSVFRGLTHLQWLFLISNRLRYFPLSHLTDMPKLEWLKLTDNLLTLRNDKFPRMGLLYEIYLNFNRIEYIGEEIFSQLDNLHLLDLSDNAITHIHPAAFGGLISLRELSLAGNPMKALAAETFLNNNFLDALYLGHTSLFIGAGLLESLVNVSFLDLTGVAFDHIDFDAINAMDSLKYINFERFYFCSMTPRVRLCRPNTDGVSSHQDLLSKPVLRYSAWTMAIVTITGNIMVLWGRCIYRDENVAVTMVIRNLALADILMGFYLVTIGIQDYRYRDEYYKISLDWIKSWQCAAVGVLAVTSSEVSMFILAFMSLERFLLIADPFRGHHRISLRNIFTALTAIWIFGVGIAVAPVALWHSSTRFYGTYSGTCFPLHIQEPYPLGWQYSAFIFLGVNFCLLLMIAMLYTALLISIWRTRKATPLSLLDCEFAVRFFFIVLTDVLCWAPIIAMKVWVFFNYNISDDVYAWLVVFILPLNSAVNPLLYTFTTPKYRNQILLRGWKSIMARRRAEPLNGLATTIATATGSSNPDDSSGKAIPLVVNY